MLWVRRQNEFGQLVRVCESPVGLYLIDGNGAGRMRWTATYPSGEYGITDSMREAIAWAEADYKNGADRVSGATERIDDMDESQPLAPESGGTA